MPTIVRIGVVGTSWWADGFHLPSLASHPRAEIAAICGRDRVRAEALALKYGIPAVFADYREMIDTGGLDALVVLAPDALHYQIVMQGLEAGLHVVCEKPLALGAVQARDMYEQAEAAGVVHMTFFTWRWVPYCRYLKQLVDEGFIGQCYCCQLRQLGGYGRGGANNW